MPPLRPFAIALVVALPVSLSVAATAAAPAMLAAVPAQVASVQGRSGFDGVVEAVRQTVVAAQVSGAVVELAVKAGDRVQAGQLLLRIDARTTNEAETKALSGGEQVNHEEWDTLPIRGTSTTKMSSTNITQNEVTHHHGLKHRSTEKCLIGHSKRLPFSLEKKKPSKRPSQGMGCQDRKEQPMSEIPF